MVVTEQRLASQIGADILKAGGNAIDAAVAVGYALAVVHPARQSRRRRVHDDRFADGRDTVLDSARRRRSPPARACILTPRAMSSPGEPSRLPRGSRAGVAPRPRHGTAQLRHDEPPAGHGAGHCAGVGTGSTSARAISISSTLGQFLCRGTNAAAIFLKDGKPYQAGDRLVQAKLAATLERLARDGADAFYRGPIAAAIVAASTGEWRAARAADFAQYTVEEAAADTLRLSRFRDHLRPAAELGRDDALRASDDPGRPIRLKRSRLSFGAQHPMSWWRRCAMPSSIATTRSAIPISSRTRSPPCSPRATPRRSAPRSRIACDAFRSRSKIGMPPHEGTNTTHYSVIDKAGNAVAVTTTINGSSAPR